MAYGKGEWWIQHRNHSGTILGEFKAANQIQLEINRNSPSSATYEIARSHPALTPDCFAPYRTDCFIYRGNDLIISGPHTSRKWSSSNEGVVSIAMNDWMHLLEKMYVPVVVTGDEIAFADRKQAYVEWPTRIANIPEDQRLGINLDIIVSDLVALRNAVDDLQWNVEVKPSGGRIPTKQFYDAHWLDGKTIYDHIKTIGGQHLGFDWSCHYVSTNHIDIHLDHNANAASYGGKKSEPVWVFSEGDQFVDFTWEDTGPKATRTFGTGQGHGAVAKLADVSVYAPSDATYRQLESTEDVGDLADMYQYSTANDDYRAIRRLTGALGHRNRGPIHQMTLSFYTSAFPFNFWNPNSGIKPGSTVGVNYDMGFHKVNSNYIVLGYSATINAQGDERITPDLERVLSYA